MTIRTYISVWAGLLALTAAVFHASTGGKALDIQAPVTDRPGHSGNFYRSDLHRYRVSLRRWIVWHYPAES